MARSGPTAAARGAPPPLKWGNKSSSQAASWSQWRPHAKWPRRGRAQANTCTAQQLKAPLSGHSISRQRPPDRWRNNKQAAQARADNGMLEMSKTDDDDVSRELVVLHQVHSSRLTWPQFTNGMADGLELAQVAATPASSRIVERTPAALAGTFQRPATRVASRTHLEAEPIPLAGEPDRDIPLGQLDCASRQVDWRGPKVEKGSEATMSSSAIMLTAARSARRPEPDLSAPPQALGQPEVVAAFGVGSGAEEPICMGESFRESFESATTTTTTTTATATATIRHEQFNNKPANFKPVRLLVPMLAFGLLLCPQPSAQANPKLTASTNDHRNQPQLDLWRSILTRLYGAAPGLRTTTDELARKLANWPDRREAALFYVDQLARRLDEEEMATTGRDGFGSRWSAICSSVSLAALMRPRPPEAINTPTQEIDPVDRDDLSLGHVWPVSLARHLQELAGGQLARLAVDNADLITQLSFMYSDENTTTTTTTTTSNNNNNDDDDGDDDGENGPDGNRHRAETNVNDQRGVSLKQTKLLLHQLVGPKFLDHTLRYQRQGFLAAARSFKSPEMVRVLHSIGLVLFDDGGADSNASLHLAYSKAALIPHDTQVSGKLIDLLSKENGESRAGKQVPDDEMMTKMPSSVLKWFREAKSVESELVKVAAERFAAAQTNSSSGQTGEEMPRHAHLSVADGLWFGPHIQCDLSTRWLLTYSLPIYSMAPAAASKQGARTHQVEASRRVQIRGVSYVNLDLASMGPLISPCAAANSRANGGHEQLGKTKQQTPSFLANTSKCHLIGASQCVPVPEYFETDLSAVVASNSRPQFRPGAYVCQCPARLPRLSQSDRLATGAQRRRLIRLLNSRDSINNLTQLLLSNPAGLDNDDNFASGVGRFGLVDRSIIAELLAKRNGGQKLGGTGRKLNEEMARMRASTVTSKSFVLGAELELEAMLNMLTGNGSNDNVPAGNNGLNGQETPSGSMARRTCRACRTAAGNESREANSTGLDQEDVQDDHLDCQPAETVLVSQMTSPSDMFVRYIRLLVLICQVVCIVATLALIGVILRIRKSRTIIVSGWMMLETMLVGALLLHVSVLVRSFQATSLTCLLVPWLRELGFSVFYGSILMKLYRMLTEFQTRKAHRVCMRDKDQIVYLLAIVLIVIAYMSAWTALMVDSFFVRRTPVDSVELMDSDNIEGMAPSWTQADEAGRLPLERLDGQIERRDTKFEPRLASGVDRQRERAPELLAPTHENNEQLAETGHDGNTNTNTNTNTNNNNNKNNQRGGTFEIRLKSSNRFVNLALGRQELGWPRGVASVGGDENKRRRGRDLVTSSDDVAQTSSGTEGDVGNLLDGQFEILARGLNSFGQLFLGLLETEQRFDSGRDTFVYLVRCRKLTWDYVTESGEIALLLFGLHLVYKLRNASMEVNKEKLILGFGLLIELITSSLVYLIRHSLWHKLTSDHLLALNALRCQLSVTLTVALVFGPKLRDIGRTKPGLLVSAMCGRWALDFLLEKCACDLLRPAAFGGATAPGAGCSSGVGAAAGTGGGGQPGACGRQRGVSVRHRCHISCEEHDHHLNDATRLHQAMLSNSALEIGSINLADMDPDEIQAELKRVYTQLELLKTKVMRRDNPHISKRRGGRKPGHRKFSLQAFHGRHSSTTAAAAPTDSSNSGQPVQQQQPAAARANCDTAASQVNAAGGLNNDGESPSGSKQQQQQQQQHNSSKRLPAVTELDGESSPAPFGMKGAGKQEERLPTYMHTIKHVRLDEPRPSQETTHTKYTQSTRQANATSAARSGKLSFSILAKRSRANNGNGANTTANSNNHCDTNAAAATAAAVDHSTAKWTPELPSTSSLGYDEDALMNDSQSSGEMTPQHRSSIIYNHQS